MKTKIVNLVGASGSGKTTVAKELEKMEGNVIQSYTTRPPREDGEWGHTFIELEPDDRFGKLGQWVVGKNKTVEGNLLAQKLVSQTGSRYKYYEMIAYFNSYKSGHHYFATDNQVLRGYTNIYIVDPVGAEMVHDFYKGTDIEVITVYLQVDREVRRKRMINRCFDKLTNEFEEVSERLSKDDKLFQTVKCDYVVDGNTSIENIIENLEGIIC